MKCNSCGEESNAGFITFIGFVCKKPECMEKADKARKDFYKKKWDSNEEVPACGNALNMNLGRFAFMFIKNLKKENRLLYEKIRANNPIFLIPEELQLKITEDILTKLPKEYIAEVNDAKGHERMFHGGTFQLAKAIPGEVLCKALADAGYLKKKAVK